MIRLARAVSPHVASGLCPRPCAQLASASHPVAPAEWTRLADALHLRIERTRDRGDGGDGTEWPPRIRAAAACHDAANHAIRAYTALPGRESEARPKARPLRSLALASLYCGFAALAGAGFCRLIRPPQGDSGVRVLGAWPSGSRVSICSSWPASPRSLPVMASASASGRSWRFCAAPGHPTG
jgi:hypothetical protein